MTDSICSRRRRQLPAKINGAKQRSECNSRVFCRLLPHQRVMLIPPTYNVSCCASPLLSRVDSCLLNQMRLYPALPGPPWHSYTLLSLTQWPQLP